MQTSPISFIALRGGGGSTQATTGEILLNDTCTDTVTIGKYQPTLKQTARHTQHNHPAITIILTRQNAWIEFLVV